MPEKVVISFPHMGNYHIPIKRVLETLLPRSRILVPPPMTRRTIELGSRVSPDYVCSPFKYNMGNYIEALEAGANVLLQTGMGCRYGYYGEVQEQILRDLGYEFEFVCMSRDRARPGYLMETFARLGCALPARQVIQALLLALETVRVMDRFEFRLRACAGPAGRCMALHESFLREIGEVSSIRELEGIRRRYARRLEKLQAEAPKDPLRVGIVGELYTLMEPYSNFYLERELAGQGVSVSRRMSAMFLFYDRLWAGSLGKSAGYLKYPVGANGADSVAQSKEYARKGYDGIIHMKAFGCTPELNAMPALQKISRDYGIPILHLSFDSHTSETGVQTRLEAFVDMMNMRRERTCG